MHYWVVFNRKINNLMTERKKNRYDKFQFNFFMQKKMNILSALKYLGILGYYEIFLSSFKICHRRFDKSNTVGSALLYLSGASLFTPSFSCGLCSSIFSFLCNVLQITACHFSFGHCIVCPSSICRFWSPLSYFQTFLVDL